MSILIKNMKMPKDCLHCGLHCGFCDGEIYCNVLYRYVEFDNESRDEECPMVEIKEPHGRLIDAEAFSSQFHKDTGRLHLITTHGFVSECIDDAPTVIEAEGDEHETTK